MTSTTKKIPRKGTVDAADKPNPSGLVLSGMGNLSALLDTPAVTADAGRPILLAITLIDEDPHQPRTEDNPGFSDESLEGLSASIRLRGVKTPISVRNNPDAVGRYIINHGARRFRSSKRADKTTIPSFIDNDYNEADQVVENLQRNELTAREIADYIGRELAKGIKKGEIARAISKSPAFVTQHVTLLDLPDPIAEAFNTGRVRDVTVINELVTAFKKESVEVTDWLNDKNQEITRGSVKLLREFLDAKPKQDQDEDGESASGKDEDAESTGQNRFDAKKKEKTEDPNKLKKAIIQVQHHKRLARLLLNRRPAAEGFAWIKYEEDGQELEANLTQVRLVAVLEG